MSTDIDTARAEFVALAPARNEIYLFLSNSFAEPPSPDLLAALVSETFLHSARELFSESLLAPLRDSVRDDVERENLLCEIRREFMDLLRVPGAKYVAPYESVYRDTREVAGRTVTGLLMGRSTVEVKTWYRLAALDISQEYKDLPDHIVLELHYLAHLCAKEQEFSAAGDAARLTRAWEMERDFLAAHIVSWISELRDMIHARSRHAYFRSISSMAVEFTSQDLATLEGVIGPSEGRGVPRYSKIDHDGPEASGQTP